MTPVKMPLDRLLVVVAALRSGEDFARANGKFVLALDLKQAQNILGIWLNVDIPVLVSQPLSPDVVADEVTP